MWTCKAFIVCNNSYIGIKLIYFYLLCSVIRHKLASEGPYDTTDKFRIDVYIDKKLVGRKQVLSNLVKRKPQSLEEVK